MTAMSVPESELSKNARSPILCLGRFSIEEEPVRDLDLIGRQKRRRVTHARDLLARHGLPARDHLFYRLARQQIRMFASNNQYRMLDRCQRMPQDRFAERGRILVRRGERDRDFRVVSIPPAALALLHQMRVDREPFIGRHRSERRAKLSLVLYDSLQP